MNLRALPARLGTLTWLKNDPTVNSGPHPGVHQQGRLVLKEPGSESFGLFGVVHPREQGLPTSHDSLENLKANLQREWALIPQEVLCASCNALKGRLKQIIKIKGSIISDIT